MGALCRTGLGAAIMVGSLLCASPTFAGEADLEARLQRLEALASAQAKRISEQDQILARQAAQLSAQALEIDRLKEEQLAESTGTGSPEALSAPPVQTARSTAPERDYAQVTPGSAPAPPQQPLPPRAVGEAPPPRRVVDVAAIPERSGVLTPQGQLVLEPIIDYTHASTNRLVFRGVEIVTGVQIGVIEASDADRDAVGGSWAVRYGLTDRLEVSGSIPFLIRNDRVTTLAQRDEQITRSLELDGRGIGDVEVAARYQLNQAKPGRTIWIASLRAKSDTGKSPFEIGRDEFGVADSLATGSGFWGVEPGISFLYPTDPIVLFGGLTYLYHIEKDVDRVVGGVLVGRVDPGDSIGVNAGFGFAVNPRFSFSLGYRHNYIFPTETELGPTTQKSESLQVGAMTFGWSYQISDRLTFSNYYEFGATSDAPDIRVSFRLPYRF